jgi:hypothetical protein
LPLQANPPNKKARPNFIGLVFQSDQNNFPENLLSIESGREFTTEIENFYSSTVKTLFNHKRKKGTKEKRP